MESFYTTVTGPDGGVSSAVVFARPNAYQDDADWGVVPEAPRLPTHVPGLSIFQAFSKSIHPFKHIPASCRARSSLPTYHHGQVL